MSTKRFIHLCFVSGASLVMASLLLFGVILFPVLKEELRYRFFADLPADGAVRIAAITDGDENTYVPANTDFSVLVPDIDANAPVIKAVDPYNETAYRSALRDGVAHAAGTSLPNEEGNMFLFAHSSDTFYQANRYNTVFYLLHKLQTQDHFYVVYKDQTYDYRITDTRTVSPDAVQYLTQQTTGQTVTLMTCWPPGTTASRLLVSGELVGVTDLE